MNNDFTVRKKFAVLKSNDEVQRQINLYKSLISKKSINYTCFFKITFIVGFERYEMIETVSVRASSKKRACKIAYDTLYVFYHKCCLSNLSISLLCVAPTSAIYAALLTDYRDLSDVAIDVSKTKEFWVYDLLRVELKNSFLEEKKRDER